MVDGFSHNLPNVLRLFPILDRLVELSSLNLGSSSTQDAFILGILLR